ncbi:rod shape-determining protein MreC [Kitasatospora purpeofusca]|uniref:rod shape-determining protein MreC n=1 Tax=Kitasatospora purpeofusca TaxID=67352 RepID=UPI000A86A83C|nr:rod shape-determining protein MreC [Kitasatospora purpeofusca]MCX4685558.1 rod shape-determining protein MreC [Kitasatospora purpeofusca]MCX4752761.1 rod shape-determining protein MreC [Kitasatospora purpeofusca]WSR32318.1 rod shape-determining protein MreC [Kitasatospora purpeofusca]WSR40409.1 rod shape-determining protein MreC [Kitasatospora purpeofusca]BEK65890.1 rod shape-determining protein MreC [Kitasatospora purpeofusca]
MRDTRESRLLLILLVAVAFALITVDIKGGESSPLGGARRAAATVLGPVERGAASAVDPVADTVRAFRDAASNSGRTDQLARENTELRQKLASSDMAGGRTKQLDDLLRTAGAGGYTVKAAQTIAIGPAQGFSWTITIDAGSDDGLTRDMTVVNGQGLVGRITTVAPTTSTVLLASDPGFTAGTRLEGTGEIGFAAGGGTSAMKVSLLNGKAQVKEGDRLVTFGSQSGRPFVPGVPVGRVVQVEATPGQLTKTVLVEPFVQFTRLDLVGVVVVPPRTDPRDAVLPPAPAPGAQGQAAPAAPAAPAAAVPPAKPTGGN